jgi:hypothetical protein
VSELIRVQDSSGRGPYRPGFSRRWSDPANQADCIPWWIELGLSIDEGHARCVGDYHFGCAFRTREQLENWFTLRERMALDRLGYRLAFIDPCVIVAETPSQVVFGTTAHLACHRHCRIESRVGRGANAQRPPHTPHSEVQ